MHDPANRTLDEETVLVCAGTDPESAAGIARRAGLLLAGRRAAVLAVWHPARLHHPVGDVLEAWYGIEEKLDHQARERAQTAAGAAATVLADLGWDVSVEVLRDERRVRTVVLERAQSVNAVVVVAGRCDRVTARPGSLGGEVRALAHHCDRPLLVVPLEMLPDDGDPVLFALDGSDGATAALSAGCRVLTRRPAIVATAWRSVRAAERAALVALPAGMVAAGVEQIDDAARRHALMVAQDACALLDAGGWSVRAETPGHDGEWQALAEAAEEAHAAVIVCGSRRTSTVAAVLLGSVAEGLLRHAGRPVLLVPAHHA